MPNIAQSPHGTVVTTVRTSETKNLNKKGEKKWILCTTEKQYWMQENTAFIWDDLTRSLIYLLFFPKHSYYSYLFTLGSSVLLQHRQQQNIVHFIQAYSVLLLLLLFKILRKWGAQIEKHFSVASVLLLWEANVYAPTSAVPYSKEWRAEHTDRLSVSSTNTGVLDILKEKSTKLWLFFFSALSIWLSPQSDLLEISVVL